MLVAWSSFVCEHGDKGVNVSELGGKTSANDIVRCGHTFNDIWFPSDIDQLSHESMKLLTTLNVGVRLIGPKESSFASLELHDVQQEHT